MPVITIDDALKLLHAAKATIGGDKPLVLDCTPIQLASAPVTAMAIIHESEAAYVELEVEHPELQPKSESFLEQQQRKLDNLWR